jgi:hypothetical protein
VLILLVVDVSAALARRDDHDFLWRINLCGTAQFVGNRPKAGSGDTQLTAS